MNSIALNPERFPKKYYLSLPYGLMLQMGYMSPHNGRRTLVGTMNCTEKHYAGVATGAGFDLKLNIFMLTYVIAIDAKEQKIIRSKSSAAANEVAAFFKRLNVSSKSKADTSTGMNDL